MSAGHFHEGIQDALMKVEECTSEEAFDSLLVETGLTVEIFTLTVSGLVLTRDTLGMSALRTLIAQLALLKSEQIEEVMFTEIIKDFDA